MHFSRLLKYHVFFLVILAFNVHINGQDPHFSQYYASPLYLAPSFTGATKGSRIVVNYRNQWPSVPGVFETYAVSFDHYFNKFHSGIGMFLMRDRSGTGNLGTLNSGLQYSYNVKLNKYWNFRPGAHVYYTQRSVDVNKLTLPDQVVTEGGASTSITPSERAMALDASTSILFHTKEHWIGLTVDHLTRPNQSLYGDKSIIPIKYSFFGGTRFFRGGRLLRVVKESISLSYNFKVQGDIYQLDLGGYWYKDPLMFGLWYRGIPLINDYTARDALVVMIGYKINNMSIGYSFDMTISRLLLNTGGSHELSLIYKFNQDWEKFKRPSQRAIPCPTF